MAGLLYCLPLTSTWLQTESSDEQSTLNTFLRQLSEECCPVVLCGDTKCGKTVMLFEAAVGYASQNLHVTYISRQPLTQMPLPVHGMIRPEAAGQLKTLTFMYMNKAENLIDYCASIHTKSLLPDVIIVDDLENYLIQLKDSGHEHGEAKLCGILKDTASFIKSKDSLGVMLLSCSDRHPHTVQIFRQFSFTVASIKPENSTDRCYCMNVQSRKTSLKLEYMIKDTGLFVKDVAVCYLPT